LQSQFGQKLYLGKQRTAQLKAAVVLSVVVRWGPAGTSVNGTIGARRG
jgi:hypothetical protein